MKKIRDGKTKKQFVKFLKDNPDLRFWQSIRNFSKYSFIYGSFEPHRNTELEDTFYIESDASLTSPEERNL